MLYIFLWTLFGFFGLLLTVIIDWKDGTDIKIKIFLEVLIISIISGPFIFLIIYFAAGDEILLKGKKNVRKWN